MQATFKLGTLLHDGDKHRLFHAFRLGTEFAVRVSPELTEAPAKGLLAAREKKWAALKDSDLSLGEN